MNRRAFGGTGITVSELGLGSSPLGGGLFYRDDKEALAVLDAACDAGITYFDTAENYGLGLHEKLFGQAFRHRRDRVVIASKGGLELSALGELGIHLRPLLKPMRGLLKGRRRALGLLRDSQKKYRFDPAHTRRALEGTLRRLNSDYVDVYQFFNVTESALEDDALFEVMERFKEEGKIRFGGATVIKIATAFPALQHPKIDVIQVPLSILDQVTVKHFLPHAREREIAVVGRSPLGGGILTDARGHLKIMESSHITEEQLASRRATAGSVRALVGEGATLAQFALRYAIQQEGVATVLFSVANRRELAENLGALARPPLSAEQILAAEALVPPPA